MIDIKEYLEQTKTVLLTQDAFDELKQRASAQSEHWIPCSERLPENSERYLVTALDGTDRRTTVAPYHPQNKTWALTGRMAYWRVLAWMPLPAPYRKEGD